MFNLFKKQEPKKEIENSISESANPSTNGVYPKEVLEIHHEFQTAADTLLLEANTIIADAATKDIVKVSRLESLGFKQASQVTELKPLIQKAELSKEQVELLKYYSFNYPNNKFITEEQVKTICHKYNLVCGEVSRFKGFVPEKNLKEIESFKLKREDKAWFYSYGGDIDSIDNLMRKYGHNLNYYMNEYNIETRKVWQENTELQICAPIKDMDISGLELTEGYKLQKKHIPDPVVLQPVKGGYLILTAWGDEASDELVVNQKFN